MADVLERLKNPSAEVLAAAPVFANLRRIHDDIIREIDSSMSWETLSAPQQTFGLLRPLTYRYAQDLDYSLVFALLVNRVQFARQAGGVNRTRADVCEMIAIRLIRIWDELGLLELTHCLVGTFRLYQNAPQPVLDLVRTDAGDESESSVSLSGDEEEPSFVPINSSGFIADDYEHLGSRGNALEMAILGEARRFIRAPCVQRVITKIWKGDIVYASTNRHAFILDDYKDKRRPITFYDASKAPFLDHYRLKVPRYRSYLEYASFIILFLLFVFACQASEPHRFNTAEVWFIVYALGFSLDKIAGTQEHGWRFYSQNLWNGFDLLFVAIFNSYLALRSYGIMTDHIWASRLGLEILTCAAAILFPRLVFVTLSGNVLILSIRALVLEFAFLMAVGACCFSGFLYALWLLGEGSFSVPVLSQWMLAIFFGLDATGIQQAHSIHSVFGPLLFIIYACLSNTLLVTVIVAILSNTFALLHTDADSEYLFRFACGTVEGVKSDALFSYMPPFNLVAATVMIPAKILLDRRWFHKFNVFMIRLLSAPFLLIITIYERQKTSQYQLNSPYWRKLTATAQRIERKIPRKIRHLSMFEGVSGPSGDIEEVFTREYEDVEVPKGKLPRLGSGDNWANFGNIGQSTRDLQGLQRIHEDDYFSSSRSSMHSSFHEMSRAQTPTNPSTITPANAKSFIQQESAGQQSPVQTDPIPVGLNFRPTLQKLVGSLDTTLAKIYNHGIAEVENLFDSDAPQDRKRDRTMSESTGVRPSSAWATNSSDIAKLKEQVTYLAESQRNMPDFNIIVSQLNRIEHQQNSTEILIKRLLQTLEGG